MYVSFINFIRLHSTKLKATIDLEIFMLGNFENVINFRVEKFS